LVKPFLEIECDEQEKPDSGLEGPQKTIFPKGIHSWKLRILYQSSRLSKRSSVNVRMSKPSEDGAKKEFEVSDSEVYSSMEATVALWTMFRNF
jgi:hypothetical protein